MNMKKHELLLVGLDNPQSTDPRYALYHYPVGCAGWRLCHQIIGLADGTNWTERRYNAIAKTNLFPVGSSVKCGKRAVEQAGELLRLQLRGQDKRVVLLGDVVRRAVMCGMSDVEMMNWTLLMTGDSTRYAWIPHPSGRNHFYNKRENAMKVGKFLRGLV